MSCQVEKNTCNYSCPTWKLASCTMAAKVSWITSWAPVHSMPWAQHKRWISIRLMACVHTHWGIHNVEGWGNPSHVRNVVENTKEDNQKVGKINQVISQTSIPRLEHDKIRHDGLQIFRQKACWKGYDGVGILRWNLEVESFVTRWIVQMEKNTLAGGGERSHVALRCCWKQNLLLLTHVKASRRKGCWLTINLTIMTKTTRAQLPK